MALYPQYYDSHMGMPQKSMESMAYDFFFDPSTLATLGGRTLEEAKCHLIILGNDVENFIKYAALVDGTTVDFLFGVRRTDKQVNNLKHKANEVKEFLRSLEVHNHEAVANFYGSVYNSLINYHLWMSHWWSFIFSSWFYHNMLQEIDQSYKVMIRNLKVYKPETTNPMMY
jgi:hypothetical protein